MILLYSLQELLPRNEFYFKREEFNQVCLNYGHREKCTVPKTTQETASVMAS